MCTPFFTNGLSFLLIHMTPKGQWTPDGTENIWKMFYGKRVESHHHVHNLHKYILLYTVDKNQKAYPSWLDNSILIIA